MFETEEDCISRKNRAVTRQNPRNTCCIPRIFSAVNADSCWEDNFLIFQAAPGLFNIQNAPNGSPFRGVLHSCSCFGGGQRHLGAGLYYSLIGRVSSHLS